MDGIEEKLKNHCLKCRLKKQLRRCPVASKLHCTSYMAVMIKAYIRKADDDDLQLIPWELYAKGLQAYNMTGDLHQVKYVTI